MYMHDGKRKMSYSVSCRKVHNYSFPLCLNSARASHSPRQGPTDANTSFIRISRICLKVSDIGLFMGRARFFHHAGKAFRDCGKGFSG